MDSPFIVELLVPGSIVAAVLGAAWSAVWGGTKVYQGIQEGRLASARVATERANERKVAAEAAGLELDNTAKGEEIETKVLLHRVIRQELEARGVDLTEAGEPTRVFESTVDELNGNIRSLGLAEVLELEVEASDSDSDLDADS